MADLEERQQQALENLKIAIARCEQEEMDIVSVLFDLYKERLSDGFQVDFSNQTLMPRTQE